MLVTGEYILGEVQSSDNSNVIIDNAAQLMLQPVSNEKMGLALIPFIPFSEGSFSIQTSAIVTKFIPNTQVINEYNRLYGYGIQIADASILGSKVLN